MRESGLGGRGPIDRQGRGEGRGQGGGVQDPHMPEDRVAARVGAGQVYHRSVRKKLARVT